MTGPRYVHMLEKVLGPELACHRATKEMFFFSSKIELQATPHKIHGSYEEFVS